MQLYALGHIYDIDFISLQHAKSHAHSHWERKHNLCQFINRYNKYQAIEIYYFSVLISYFSKMLHILFFVLLSETKYSIVSAWFCFCFYILYQVRFFCDCISPISLSLFSLCYYFVSCLNYII